MESFNVPCASVQNADSTWSSDEVAATLTPHQVAQVQLSLDRGGRARMTINFIDEPPVAPDGTWTRAALDAPRD